MTDTHTSCHLCHDTGLIRITPVDGIGAMVCMCGIAERDLMAAHRSAPVDDPLEQSTPRRARTRMEDRPLVDQIAIAIGKAEGFDSITVARKLFRKHANAVLLVLADHDAANRPVNAGEN